jgi:hypothetical protein
MRKSRVVRNGKIRRREQGHHGRPIFGISYLNSKGPRLHHLLDAAARHALERVEGYRRSLPLLNVSQRKEGRKEGLGCKRDCTDDRRRRRTNAEGATPLLSIDGRPTEPTRVSPNGRFTNQGGSGPEAAARKGKDIKGRTYRYWLERLLSLLPLAAAAAAAPVLERCDSHPFERRRLLLAPAELFLDKKWFKKKQQRASLGFARFGRRCVVSSLPGPKFFVSFFVNRHAARTRSFLGLVVLCEFVWAPTAP